MIPLLALAGAALAGDFVYEGSMTTLHSPGIGVVWPIDLAVIGVGAGLYFALDPLEPLNKHSEVAEVREGYKPHWNPGARVPSDVLGHPLKFHSETLFLNGPVVTVVGLGVASGIAYDGRSGLADSILVVQSITTAGALAVGLKHLYARPRPFTSTEFQQELPDIWASEDIQDRYGPKADYDAFKSFPSGHAASAGATYFSAATLVWLHSTDDYKLNATFYIAEGLAIGLTATTGALRVDYGVHTFSDVLWGGLLGGSIGFISPMVHSNYDPAKGMSVRLQPIENGVALTGQW